jgi:hypothetical protein
MRESEACSLASCEWQVIVADLQHFADTFVHLIREKDPFESPMYHAGLEPSSI